MNINYRLAPQVNGFPQNIVFNILLGSTCLPTFGTFSMESAKVHIQNAPETLFQHFTLLVGVWFVCMHDSLLHVQVPLTL